MGTLYIPIKALFENLGLSVVIPPPPSKRTLALGGRYAPEFACLPMKLNIGNYLEALEAGAEVIIMGGGTGPCRFGYYAQVQNEILKDLGYQFEMIVLEPPQGHVLELYRKIRELVGSLSLRDLKYAIQLAWDKVLAIDRLQVEVHRLAGREVERGRVNREFEAGLGAIDRANSFAAIRQAAEESLLKLKAVKVRPPAQKPLRVGIIGEIYMVLEPFANLEVEKHLAEMGVEVVRKIFLGEWVRDHLFLNPFRLGRERARLLKLARPYLGHFVGGHGLETIANTVEMAGEGVDGVIQIAPFTCMPEIVAESILPRVSQDHGIPSLTLYLDEQSGEAGLLTRLEAFVDLLRRRNLAPLNANLHRAPIDRQFH
ncbi:MAG: CoA protein activase [Firmicutes bacterium]|nr:CoA protein activase [Bacillota bacterium]